MARLFTLATGTYSVVELDDVAAVNTGQIKSQYAMASSLKTAGAQQGQLLVVDEKAKQIKLPTAVTELVYLHASEEQIYDSVLGRNSFIQKSGLPKMLKLHVGDTFETNAVDKGAYADRAAVVTGLAGGVVNGTLHTTGDIKLIANASLAGTEVVLLEMLEFVTLPNGLEGIKFVVRKA
jgi:hypothetical protein